MDSLYNENHIWGRLFRKFMDLFPQATKPTKKLLALFLIGQLCTEHFTSVRNLHKTFLSSVCDKKLNSYYHALSNDKIANTQIRQMLAKMSLSIIPDDVRIKIEQVKMRISHSPNRGIIETGGISPWQTILTSNLSWMQSSTTRNMRSLG